MRTAYFSLLVALTVVSSFLSMTSAAEAACYARFSNNIAQITACERSSGRSGYLEIINRQSSGGVCYEVIFRSGRTQKGCFAGRSSQPACFRCARSNDGVKSVILTRR